MAVPVVSSTSTAENFGSSGDLTVTAPTGISDGDKLLLVAGGNASTIDSSGFTQISNVVVSTSTCMTRAFYKVASSESGDYTVTHNAPDGIAAAMLRITGDALALFNFDTESDESSSDTVSKQSPSLLVMFGKSNDNIAHSGYQITHGGSNPTWTELYDVEDTSPDQAFFCAYATTTDTTDVTAWQYTEGSSATNTAQLIAVLSQQDDAVTYTTPTVSPTFFEPTASVGVTVTPTFFSASPTFFEPAAVVKNPTWTNQERTTTTWTNQER